MDASYEIPGFPRYLLSGSPIQWQVIGRRGLPLAGFVNAKENRPMYSLANDQGQRRVVQLGRVVLLALVGPPPAGMECCHRDGDPWNNDPANLRWDTHRANVLDMVAHGRSGRFRIPQATVDAIRAEYVRRPIGNQPGATNLRMDGSLHSLAAKYGVHHGTVWGIVNGRRRS